MADPYDFDPMAAFGTYRATSGPRAGRRIIPTINNGSSPRATAANAYPDPYAMHAAAHGPIFDGGQRPAAQPAPPPPIFEPMPANRFGSSNRFQESLDRTRALRSFRASRFADLRTAGQDMRAAAQGAYADSAGAEADMGTGNFFLNRELRKDENTRQNAESGANVGLVGSQAKYNTALADVGVPATAEFQRSEAYGNRTAANNAAAMLPYGMAAADIANKSAAAAGAYAGPSAAAGVKQQEANVGATEAGVGMTKQYQQQLKDANARIARLEGLLAVRPHEPTGVAALEPGATATTPMYGSGGTTAYMKPPAQYGGRPGGPGTPAATPATQPAETGTNLPRVSTPDEARRLPSGTKFVGPDGVVRQVP